ncbi:MAG TPA: hypothetical protein VF702_01890 [Allosphingosinicella sp.]
MLGDLGPHGSDANDAAWMMAFVAHFMLVGLFVGGGVSVMLAAWGAQRREARLDTIEARETDGR